MLSFLEGLLIKWATKLLDSFIGWFYKKIVLYFKGSKHVKDTEERVEKIKDLQKKAKIEITEKGEVSESTREAIRMAGRELIRGKRN